MDPPLCMWARVRIRLCPGREEEEDEEEEEEEEEERGGEESRPRRRRRKKGQWIGKEKKTERAGGRANEPSPPRLVQPRLDFNSCYYWNTWPPRATDSPSLPRFSPQRVSARENRDAAGMRLLARGIRYTWDPLDAVPRGWTVLLATCLTGSNLATRDTRTFRMDYQGNLCERNLCFVVARCIFRLR